MSGVGFELRTRMSGVGWSG